MQKVRGRKFGRCAHCGRRFELNPRLGKKHRFCGAPECRKAAKAHSQKQWLNRPENSGHFSGPDNALRVRIWRTDNPRPKRPPRNVLRLAIPQLSAALRACGVQDLNSRQLALVLGIVSVLARTRVQESIARKIRRLMLAGYAVLRPADSPPSRRE